MELDIIRRSSLPQLDDSDEEALDLFNNLNPNPESPSAEAELEVEVESEGSRRLGRLSKLKKNAKKEKKKLKRKEKKMRRLQKKARDMETGHINIVTPLKPNKKRKNQLNSDSEAAHSHDAGSSEFSSESEDREGLKDELLNLNPDAEEPDSSPRKRLKKSGRKERIEEKEGFRVEELGNEALAAASKFERDYDDEDYSFDDVGKRNKKKTRKPKPTVPSNEQIMNNLKEQVGVVESDGEEGAAPAAYDNGLDSLYAMKDKRKGGIKINNKFFSDLEIDARAEEAQMPTPENLQLELKPKASTHSSSRFTFLSKAESLKKQRGLENSVDAAEYDRRLQERAKQSMAKVVTSMIAQDYHDDIDLQVRVPTIARGKSADIINNTVFLKSFATKHETPEPTEPQPAPLTQTKSCGAATKKEGLSRAEFYKQISNDQRMRRSKYISEEQLKDSFKKTNLGELEEARKRNQEKRRKEALSEESEQEEYQPDSAENKMDELLEEEERICGDIANEDENEAQPEAQKDEMKPIDQQQLGQKLEEVEISIKLQEEAAEEEPEEKREANEEVIDQLASASHDHPANPDEMEVEEEEEEEEEDQEEEEEEEQEEQEGESSPEVPESAGEPNQEQMELEEEGIMLRKRKAEPKPKQELKLEPSQNPIPSQDFTPTPQDDKENAINLPNTIDTPSKPVLSLSEEKSQQFREFRKLRKFAMVIAEKKRKREEGRRYASQFIEQEAEEGSDNEEHDDMIKKIDYDAENREYEGVDLDAELVELIDNAVDLNEEDEQEAFRKYLEDIRIKDREEIRKIIRGEFRTRNADDELDMDEDERRRQERMEEVMNWMKKREEEDGQGIYFKPEEEEEQEGSEFDSDSEYLQIKRRKAEEKAAEKEADRIPEEEEKAMIERFLDNTLPVAKRDAAPSRQFTLGPLPESVIPDKGATRTIGASRFGIKALDALPKPKKTSSLTNEVFSRNSVLPKRPLVAKLGGRK